MPRDGAFTFGDLIGRLDHLEIECTKCSRLGRYAVHRLVDELGGDPGCARKVAIAFFGNKSCKLTDTDPAGLTVQISQPVFH